MSSASPADEQKKQKRPAKSHKKRAAGEIDGARQPEQPKRAATAPATARCSPYSGGSDPSDYGPLGQLFARQNSPDDAAALNEGRCGVQCAPACPPARTERALAGGLNTMTFFCARTFR